MNKIITHGGDAHLDDILSCAFVIAKEENIEMIERRNPKEKEIDDKNIWILDIGRIYDPDRLCFDHHGSEFKGRKDSTISLLLKEWGLWKEAIELFPSIEATMLLDSMGPPFVLKKYKAPPISLSVFGGFVMDFLVTEFSKHITIEKDDFIFNLLYKLGKFLFDSIEDYRKIKESVLNNFSIEIIEEVPIIIYTKKHENKKVLYNILTKLKNDLFGKGGISIVAYNRPEGSLGVMRYDDDPRVDFTRIRKTDDIFFIHNNGFFMSIKNMDMSNVLNIVKGGIKSKKSK